MSKRAVIYLRVSTTDQSTENQLPELERICEEKGWGIVEVLEEESSAWEGRRENFQQLFEMAHRQEYDVLVVWSLDRLDRRGIQETLQSLKRLDEHDIQFYSYQEPYLSTLEAHTRELIISVLSWVAQMESERRSERVKAGLQRARENGKDLGRPKKANDREREMIRKMYHDDNLSMGTIADKTDLSKGTIHNIINED
jgi:putative DNA-invertase from lambdoid prophage Rac